MSDAPRGKTADQSPEPRVLLVDVAEALRGYIAA